MKKIIFSCLFCRHHKECWFDNSFTSKKDSWGLTTYRHKKTGGRASLVSFDCRSISCWYWMGGSTWHGPCIEPTRLLSLWFDSYTCTTTIMSLCWSKPHTVFFTVWEMCIANSSSNLILDIPIIPFLNYGLTMKSSVLLHFIDSQDSSWFVIGHNWERPHYHLLMQAGLSQQADLMGNNTNSLSPTLHLCSSLPKGPATSTY